MQWFLCKYINCSIINIWFNIPNNSPEVKNCFQSTNVDNGKEKLLFISDIQDFSNIPLSM